MVEITSSNPPTVRAPTGYSLAISVKGAERRLVISGQIGMTPDGEIPGTGEGQIAQALANLRAVLEANGMGPANVIKTTVFLTDRTLLAAYRSARGAFFDQDPPPASTLLFISGLVDPRLVVEIEAEAVA